MRPLRSVLIVEDEVVIRTSLCEFLQDEEYQITVAGNVAEAMLKAREKDFHVAICDVQLPDGDGVQLLRRLQQMNPNLLGLIITAYATVENAVEAFKAGAFDYLVKPVLFDDLENKLRRLFQYRELALENQSLRKELARRDSHEEIIGSSRAIKAVQDAIRKVSLTKADVLLVGESGVGKELCARTIHRHGPKADCRFLVMSCTSRSAEELESELFGSRVAGGAESLGLLRTAGEGTVYLDEISALPLSTQTRLLRAIEYREATPMGCAEPYKVTARILAATSAVMNDEVTAGRLHEDLYYRLNGTTITIPPLRDRLDDIPELVDHFITRHSAAMGQRVAGASSDTIRLLMSAPWRGNVRQLDNAIQRAVMMSDGSQLKPQDLPPDLAGVAQPLPDADDLRSALRHYERLHIVRVLRQTPDKREAAKRLKLGLSSLYRKIEELNIDL